MFGKFLPHTYTIRMHSRGNGRVVYERKKKAIEDSGRGKYRWAPAEDVVPKEEELGSNWGQHRFRGFFPKLYTYCLIGKHFA